MHPEYAAGYGKLYEKHWWWRAREELILATLERVVPPHGAIPILDVGCGDGLFFEKLQRFGPVEGIEMDPTGVNPQGSWADRIRVRPFDASFEPGRRYGLILLLDVLEHFEDPAPPLRRAVELLEEGGVIVVTVPAFRGQWTGHDEINRHFHRFTRATLLDLVARSGARAERVRYFFHWTSPFKVALHWKEALFGGRPAPPRIPPRPLNALLYAASRIEQRLFGRWPVPFGSSLIAVVRGPEGSRQGVLSST